MDVCVSSIRWRRSLAALLALGLTACSGDEPVTSAGESQASAGETSTGGGEPATTTGDDGDDTTTGAPQEPDNPFDLNRENVRLLPFAVRLGRLTSLLDRPESDPAFALLLSRRYDLGDYNYAEGIGPDLTWGAGKMATWAAAMRPVCASPAYQERYPEMPLDLPALMRDAWGFEPTPADLEDYAELFKAPDPEAPPPDPDDKGSQVHILTDAERAEIACLAVLSSLEFVGQ